MLFEAQLFGVWGFSVASQTSTIGLVTLNEMKAKQQDIVKERERKLAQKQAEKEREQERQLEAKKAEKRKQKQQASCNVTFMISTVHFNSRWKIKQHCPIIIYLLLQITV